MQSNTALIPLVLGFLPMLVAGQAPPAHSSLERHYREGETLVYRMNGVNESWHYSIQADGVVKKDAAGAFVEEYAWSHLISDGQPTALSPQTDTFRQRLALNPNTPPGIPDLTRVDPRLIGPITDLMTFYVDLWLAVKTGHLTKPGDHFYLKLGTPSSWADGSRVLVGQSSVDFDFTWKSSNPADQTALLEIRHVPPEKSLVPLAADWMQKPVGDMPNNWVMIMKTPDNKFRAGVGQETFTVDLTVSLADGKILSATMDNPVKTETRLCDDQALTQCGPPEPHLIVRKIDIALVPPQP